MNFPKLNERIEELTAYLNKREKHTESGLHVVVSPYSISPLGADIAGQGGPALGMTINAYTVLVLFPTKERKIRLYSMNYPGVAEFGLGNIKRAEKNDWGRYVRGAAKVFNERYSPEYGFCGAVYGTLPASGLGTSSSECLAYLSALAEVNNVEPLGWEHVELVRRIENDYLKESGGTLDQVSIAYGEKNCMLHVVSGTGDVSAYPGPKGGEDFKILVAYPGRVFESAAADFNRRSDECRKASGFLAIMAGLRSAEKLSDIPSEVFVLNSPRLPDELRLRAERYFTEAERVERGLRAWKEGDLETLGRLMNESCRGMLDNCQTVSAGLKTLHEIISSAGGVYGSTVNGGCVIACVRADFGEQSASEILHKYVTVCPEAQDKAAVYFAHSEWGIRSMTEIYPLGSDRWTLKSRSF